MGELSLPILVARGDSVEAGRVNVGLKGFQGEPEERGKEGKAHLGQEAFPPGGEKAGRMLSVLGESWRETV